MTAYSLVKVISDLKEINSLDIQYLLVNRNLSFVDVSTLRMIEKKITVVISDLEKLEKKGVK